MDNKAIKALAALAAKSEDQSITKKGGDFERRLPAAGRTVARFIEYVELGMQPQKAYAGKDKEPAEMVRITFEFTAPKYRHEVGEGDNKFTIADKISLKITKGFYERSGYKALFEKMRYGRDNIVHMAQMLGEGFIITIEHNKSDKGDKVYANIKSKTNGYMIEAPFVNDPIAETSQAVPVPAALSELKLFVWNHPSKESWESIYIDGVRTVKEGDTETEVSKNWIQGLILSATNYEGSPLEEMFTEAGIDPSALEAAPEEAEEEEVVAEEEVKATAKKPAASVATKPKSAAKPTATTATKASPSAKPSTTGAKPVKAAVKEDPLTALGLA